MTNKLTRHCLLLCPPSNVPAANAAAGDVTWMAAPGETFSPGNIMIRDGVEYAVAGVYVTTAEYAELEPFATDLGGYYYVLKQKDSNGEWHTVNEMADLMSEHNITRPEIDEPL